MDASYTCLELMYGEYHVPENPDEKTIAFEGVSITYLPWFAGGATALKMPAFSDPSGFMYDDYPAHVRFDFANPYTARKPFVSFQPGWVPWLSHQHPANPVIVPQIFIFQTTNTNALFSERITTLKTLLDGKALTAGQELPVLPTFNSAQDLYGQVKPIVFQGGRGLRFITRYSQGATPVINPAVFYTFQGLANDGRHYVAAFFPVHISILPDQARVEDWDAFNRTYQDYMADITSQLEMLDPGGFVPGLETLDALISSISIDTME